MNNKINRSPLIAIVAVFCLIISGCLGGGAMSQDLPDCETLYGAMGHWTNCQGDMTTTHGDQYVGEFKDNMRSGHGTYTFVSGDQYVGEYKDNMENGQGTLTYANGDQYVGEFKDHFFHGQGTYTYANGDQEEGIFEEGNFIG